MKRRILSFILVLSAIVSLLAPLKAAADETQPPKYMTVPSYIGEIKKLNQQYESGSITTGQYLGSFYMLNGQMYDEADIINASGYNTAAVQIIGAAYRAVFHNVLCIHNLLLHKRLSPSKAEVQKGIQEAE